MEREQIISLLYDGKYDELQAKGIKWWEDPEIIREASEGAAKHFSSRLMSSFDFLQILLKKIPKGSVKDKELAKKIIEIANCDQAADLISEELQNDREILVRLVVSFADHYTYLPKPINEKAKNDYRIMKLADLVALRSGLLHEVYSFEQAIDVQREEELLKEIKELDERIETLSKEIIESDYERESPTEKNNGAETKTEHQTEEITETVDQEEVRVQEDVSIRTTAQNVEDNIRRFEELFLSEEALQKALQRDNHRESYIRSFAHNGRMAKRLDPIGLSSFRDVAIKEEIQTGTGMPHGNNLFGLNCHVKRDENGEVFYTLTLNEGVFQPQKTYWKSTKLSSDGSLGGTREITRWSGAEVAFVPSQTKVNSEVEQPCVTMSREEILENVRDFFSMTNEEVIRRYDIRGPHKFMLVQMIMLDAIYQREQEVDGCGRIKSVSMDSDVIRYESKSGEEYYMSGITQKGKHFVSLEKGSERVEVEFKTTGPYRNLISLDDIEITGIEISGNSEILTLIKERLEGVFAPKKHEHTLEEVEEGVRDVPIEHVSQVMGDIIDDGQRKKPSHDGQDDIPSYGE